MTDIQSLRELEREANNGEWLVRHDDEGAIVFRQLPIGRLELFGCADRADAERIVATHNALPGLLDELEQLREENATLRRELREQTDLRVDMQFEADRAGVKKWELEKVCATNDKALCIFLNEHAIDIYKMEKWAEAECDGRLIVLPCKVGDMVYQLRLVVKCEGCPNNRVDKCKFHEGECHRDNRWVVREMPFQLSDYSLYKQNLVHGLYSTREAAEKALADKKARHDHDLPGSDGITSNEA